MGKRTKVLCEFCNRDATVISIRGSNLAVTEDVHTYIVKGPNSDRIRPTLYPLCDHHDRTVYGYRALKKIGDSVVI